MAEFDIHGKITYDATQAQTALKQTATAADTAAASTTKVAEASKTASVNVGQFGSSIGLAGQAVSKLSPEMGGLVTMVGSATGAMQSLMTAGLGPVGLAIGAVSVALSAATAMWNQQEEAVKRNEQALREYDKIQSEIAERNRQNAIDDEIRNLDREYYHSEEARRARAQASWERGYNARREADLRTMSLLAEGLPQQPDRPRGGGGRRHPSATTAPATTPMGYDSESAQQELARLEQDMADEADVRRRMRELDIEEQNAAKDRSIEIARERNEEQMRLAEEQAARMQEINDAVFSALESALSTSVNAWLDGSKSMGEAAMGMVRDIARALTAEAIIQGLKQTALGIGALAMGSPSAAGHFLAAGKWAAVGVAAGITGAATGAFGGAGGGGGAAPAPATGGPALTAGAREGAGQTVIINWGSSGLIYAADRAQLGRDISGMIGEAHSRLGRGM